MIKDETEAAIGKPAGDGSAAGNWLVTLGVNIALPTATYFLLVHAGSMQQVPALLLSGLWPAAEIGYTLVRQRHVDEFGVFALIGIVIGVITALYSATARAVFMKDSITTGCLGLIMLLTLLRGRPLTFYLGRRFATDASGAQRDWWDGLWQYPRFRKAQRRLAAVWGLSLLGEATGRAVLTREFDTSAMVLVNNVVPYAVIATLALYSSATGRREQAAAQIRHDGHSAPVALAN